MGADGASGRIGDEFAWELTLEGAEEPLFHLPRGWMYRARLPRTKLLSPAPAARFSGRLSVDGREIPVDGWRGMAGHNWGAQHAERWIWLHGITADGDWLDAAIGRVKLGPATTPWVGNGALSIAGDRYALRRAKVTEAPGPLHVRAVRERRAGARQRVGAAGALRGLGLRGSGRVRAPHRELLDRRHAAEREPWRGSGVGARGARAAPRTSSACASTTTASRSSRSPDG